MKLRIKKEQAGVRLDKFLVAKLKNKTRGQAQQMIANGAVLVNGKILSNHYALKENEIIEVKSGKATIMSKDVLVEPEVIFANKEFIVVNKPAGLIVHGAPHIKEPTLADWLVKKYPELKKVGEDKARPGIMHRLDKDVSGLLVIARTNDSFYNLKKQFQNREVEKIYTALVYGQIAKENDKINFSLKRSAGGHRQAAVPEGYNFKENFLELREAFTEFQILKRMVNYTLLSVKIKSGRKHQIRVHLFAYGFPLVGDNLYSTVKTRQANRKIDLGRIFLVASRLSFKDLSGKKNSFRVGLPEELEDFLQSAK
ncbi:MAG: RluA family pseudouridine synthase [Patescibacteria group bacterium]|nr:RluA family pseudouridine synthase [Patescibacteria group bacterium]